MKLKKKKNIRLGWVFFLACFTFAAVLGRLIHLQVFLAPKYNKIVKIQSSGEQVIPAIRGLIYDRNGMIVANNIELQSLSAWPKNEKEVKKISVFLEDFFDLPNGTAVKKYKLAPLKFSWIKRNLSDDVAAEISKQNPIGLHLQEEIVRSYPFGEVGKQITGFTNIDCKGQAGFELWYNSELAGKSGMAAYRRDGNRNRFRIKEQAIRQPIPGKSKVLTIDWQLQEILEEELKAGVIKHNAELGMAVFLNNQNGEIIAMAHYDPNDKNRNKPQKLRVLTDLFEPGSVYKIIAATGLLEDSIININDTIYCENGLWKMGRNRLRDDHKHEWLNFRSIIELSSNIGIGKYAVELGGEELYQLSHKFGIGEKALPGWPGEQSGYIKKPKRWSDFNVASLSIGHAVAVNALQMANAMAAVANGGTLYQPKLILCDVDEKGNPVDVKPSKVIAELMSKKTSDTLRSFLRGVVERGTAEGVNSPIVTIAGKTGTAQIYDTERKRYSHSKYMASFAGFFPAENPLVTGIVVMKNPQPVHYGGLTSGITFRRIAERYTIIHPDLFTAPARMIAENSDKIKKTQVVPNFIGQLLVNAQKQAGEKMIKLRATADSGFVVWQYPSADRLIFEDDEVLVVVQSDIKQKQKMVNLTGLSVREVSAYMQHMGLKYSVVGNGKVYRQSIKPGEFVQKDSSYKLECKPI